MASDHYLIATGHIGGDPEMRYTTDGMEITSFSLPVTKGYGDKEKTTWLKVSCFRKTAVYIAEHAKKGNLVTARGQIYEDAWTGKDGQARTTIKMDADNVQILERKK